ncbi:MAG: hypothetical protein H0V80_10365 [Acidobacteria bacterium]|nr:hypothetical protein [Acidobacteriota bacterium]
MSAITVGSLVVHRNLPLLGFGKVFCIGYMYALVGFIDASGRREVKRLGKTFIEPASDLSALGQFDGWRIETTSDCHPVAPSATSGTGKSRKAVGPAAWTLNQAYERFVAHYPDGMSGAQYQNAERTWKANQRELWAQQFPPGHLRALAADDPLAAGALVMKVVQTKEVALLARKGELPVLNWALTKGSPAPFLLALADVVEQAEPTRATFEALAEALESLPTLNPGTRVLSWPTLTVVPFLVRPDVHMFLKPKPTQETARQLGVDLFYNARPSWDTYQRLLTWSQGLLDFLKPHGARDMVDVQSFIWTVSGPVP